MWTLSVSCEYRCKTWRGKDGKSRQDPDDALEIQRKFNGETQAKKQRCQFKMFYRVPVNESNNQEIGTFEMYSLYPYHNHELKDIS